MDVDLANFVRAQLENQFMTGGLVVVAFTALLAILRNVPDRLSAMVQRAFITTVDVTDHDAAFFWIQAWLGEHEYTRRRARLLTASTRKKPYHSNDNVPTPDDPNRKRDQIEIVFSPAPGAHLIRFRGSLMLLRRERREAEDITGGLAYHETLVVRSFSRSAVRELIEEARELAYPPEDDSVGVFRDNYGSWRLAMKRTPRSVESVVLAGDTMSELLADLRRFFASSDWYREHGIPYQRGYVVHGPPGNGKTSLVVAVASLFGRDIYIVRASATTDDAFQRIMSEVPEHGIVLIEDVDCMWDKREAKSENQRMTFSGFLNGIDGVAAPQGRVLFMTTNHLSRLDPAMVRPGRADRVFHLNDATPDQARRLFLNFFPGRAAASERFAEAVRDRSEPPSMARLQEHILVNAVDHEAAALLDGSGRPT